MALQNTGRMFVTCEVIQPPMPWPRDLALENMDHISVICEVSQPLTFRVKDVAP